MKILLIGASGAIGSRVLAEALARGHDVTALARHMPEHDHRQLLTVVQADAREVENLARLAAGQDALVSAMSPRSDGGQEQFVEAVHGVLRAVEQANVPYVLFVGGASSLESEPGKRVLDSLLERMPREQLSEAIVMTDVRDLVAASPVNWTFLSPAGTISPGKRTGHFRLGGMQPVKDEQGKSQISMEDYAVAVLDELERPRHVRQQFNVGY
jgi:putative NADH-flavin reductase